MCVVCVQLRNCRSNKKRFYTLSSKLRTPKIQNQDVPPPKLFYGWLTVQVKITVIESFERKRYKMEGWSSGISTNHKTLLVPKKLTFSIFAFLFSDSHVVVHSNMHPRRRFCNNIIISIAPSSFQHHTEVIIFKRESAFLHG